MTADEASSGFLTKPPRDRRSLLTQRELEVLAWISAGKSNPETAIIMGISPWTVKIHVANIYKKLDVCSRGQAVARAISLRLLDGVG
jgi:DNA-binding CsgD family transcriptional regulator